ncbi:hypothetical protein GUITHDRAFT_117862 [Guillardia theta CCMP2712]|uniref:Uncharacterized protein n=2 Tax=Guillardia theta TaxID=55529 RepID=L1IIM5_GUITC|nr:hypothetical protein GUITHDRAFT_117862 [Guillardia theta CCMP2712]EKX35947.1 hypothetical protein GUITHDRAFT_117862 [Guillardia theta CCMP2712]|eukprot:XP_005822927.1 hypothetical protein GUITHDRAFT_117862 [Guillardia theta CCMP2712]
MASPGRGTRRHPEERHVASYISIGPGTPKQSPKRDARSAGTTDGETSTEHQHAEDTLSSPSSSVATPTEAGERQRPKSQSARRKLLLDESEETPARANVGMLKRPFLGLDISPPQLLLPRVDDLTIKRAEFCDKSSGELLATLCRALQDVHTFTLFEQSSKACSEVLSLLQDYLLKFQMLQDRIVRGVQSGGIAWDVEFSRGAVWGKGAAGEPESSFQVAMKQRRQREQAVRSAGEEQDGCDGSLSDVSQSVRVERQEEQSACSSTRSSLDDSSGLEHKFQFPASSDSLEGYGSSQRSLHDKFLSPDRHRKCPDEMQKRQEEKQLLALKKRAALEAQKQEKLRDAEMHRQERLRQASCAVKEKRQNTQYIIHERLQRAEKLHQAQILERQRKARQEHSKVHGVKEEIAFIELLNAESRTAELQSRLELAESRRLQSLEAVSKSTEKAAKEEAAKRRRLQLEEEKLQRLEARYAQKFGSSTPSHMANVMENAEASQLNSSECAAPAPVSSSSSSSLSSMPLFAEGEGELRTSYGGAGESSGRRSISRDEAARMRRTELENERQRRVEQASQEKIQRAEERQKKIFEERMLVLANKEAKIRHQAEQLNRITAEMQADAEKQKKELEIRLQSVVQRKQHYMQEIIAKAHAASEPKSQHAETGLKSEEEVATRIAGRPSSVAVREEPSSVPSSSLLEAQEKFSRGMKKRARKFRQRLQLGRSKWNESQENSASWKTMKDPRGMKAIADLAKFSSFEEKQDGQIQGNLFSRHLEEIERSAEELYRLLEAYDCDYGAEARGDPMNSVGGGGGGETKKSMLAHIRRAGVLAALMNVLGLQVRIQQARLLQTVMKVLAKVCEDEMNRLSGYESARTRSRSSKK